MSCKRHVDEDCPKCPRVTSVVPGSAYFGDTVLISGKNLLPNPSYNDILQVKFNGNLIPDEYILENYEDSIRLIIPHGTQSGPVTVDINIQDELISAQSGYFNYLPLSNVITYAGTGEAGTVDALNNNPLDAKFFYPKMITFDPALKSLFVVERHNSTSESFVRRIDSTGNVITLPATTYYIVAIACDNGGQKYVAASNTFSNTTACKIYKLSNTGALTGWANNACGYQDNTLALAEFSDIKSITFDNTNNLYVTDGNRIRKIDIASGMVTTITGTGVSGFGDGQADSAKFNSPNSVIVENDATIYISDKGNNVIRKLKSGVVSTVAGSQGTADFINTGIALSSHLDNPRIVISDYTGNIYILESGHCIRKIVPAANSIKIFAGKFDDEGSVDGLPLVARFDNPNSMTYDRARKTMYVADTESHKIRKISFE